MLPRGHDTYVYPYSWMQLCRLYPCGPVSLLTRAVCTFVRLFGDQLEIGVVVHSISRPASLFLLGQYMDGGIRMVSEAVRHLDLHMQHHHSPSPFPWPMYVSLSSAIHLRLGPLTCPPSCSTHSFGIQGFQHCPSSISCLGPQGIYVV